VESRVKIVAETEKYPYLGMNVAQKRIVLFTANKAGVVVFEKMPRPNGTSTLGLGHTNGNIPEDDYVPFSGSVTLSN